METARPEPGVRRRPPRPRASSLLLLLAAAAAAAVVALVAVVIAPSPHLLLASLLPRHGPARGADAWGFMTGAPKATQLATPDVPNNAASARAPAFRVTFFYNGECCNEGVTAEFAAGLTGVDGTFAARAAAAFPRRLGTQIDPASVSLYDAHGLIDSLGRFLARNPSALAVGSPAGARVWVAKPGALFVWPTVSVGHVHVPQGVASADPARPLEIETLSESPRVFWVHNFLSDAEIDTLVGYAKDKLERSHVGIGNEVFSDDRTSKTAWDTNSENSLKIQHRVFDLVRVPYSVHQADAVQIIRYFEGQTYVGHTDYFRAPTGYENSDPSVPDGTNRFITVFAYLSDVDEGGHTVFPKSRSHPPHMTAKTLHQAHRNASSSGGGGDGGDGQVAVEVGVDGAAANDGDDGSGSRGDGGCIGWRQTADCDPSGTREPAGDLPCHARVRNGISGFCDCGEGRHVMRVTCEHSAFSCGNACRGRVSDGTTQTGDTFDRFVRECDSGDGLAVPPKRGDALLFYSQTPNARLDPESYHGGCPVIRGEKWAANVWIWNRKRPVFGKQNTQAKESKTGMQMAFLNGRGFPVEVYWVTFAKELQYFDRIAPGARYTVNTHVGHEWVVKHGDRELRRFTADRGLGSAVTV